MSYASDVKKELTMLEVHFGNAKAELMALIRMNGSLSIVNKQFVLSVQTENPASYCRDILIFQKTKVLLLPPSYFESVLRFHL